VLRVGWAHPYSAIRYTSAERSLAGYWVGKVRHSGMWGYVAGSLQDSCGMEARTARRNATLDPSSRRVDHGVFLVTSLCVGSTHTAHGTMTVRGCCGHAKRVPTMERI